MQHEMDPVFAAVGSLAADAKIGGYRMDPGRWASERLDVHAWSKQREVLESVRDHKRTVVQSCHGAGKDLPLTTPLPTPSGWVTMETVRVGDHLIGLDGEPVEVVAKSRLMHKPVAEVEFDDGTRVVCGWTHEWITLSAKDRQRIRTENSRNGGELDWRDHWDSAQVCTTRQIGETLRNDRGQYDHAVPLHRPLQGNDVDFDDAPEKMGAAGVLDEWAMRASLEQRMEYFSGLCLAFGTVNDQGHVVLSMPKPELAEFAHRLAITLAYPVYGGSVRIGDEFQLRVLTRCNPFSEHGREHQEWETANGGRKRMSRTTIRSIVAVREIQPLVTQCVQVDSDAHAYLAGPDMVPTHNSMIASVASAWWLDVHPPGEAIVVSCYTGDTEVLTREGWKLFADVRTGEDGDEFATRNPETKQFEWQSAFRYYEAPWDGEVVDVQGRTTDLRVTPNHRMLVQWATYSGGAKTSGETFKRADAIGPRGAEIPALSVWEGKTPETVTFGGYTWDTGDFAAFLGAWIAEGSLGPPRTYTKKGGYGGSIAGDQSTYGGYIALTQLTGTKGYDSYRDLLVRMLGREPAYTGGKTWVFSCSELYAYLEKLGKAHEKYIPSEVKEWGPEALSRFLEFYLLGDGWFQKSRGRRAGEGYGSWRSCTVSKKLADDLQEVAQKTGKFATVTERPARDGGVLKGGRKILKENCRAGYYLMFGDSATRTVKTSRSHYTGNVYCVSVPNETLYVRRGGSAVWCGNTAPTYAQVNKILWEEVRKHHRRVQARAERDPSMMPLPGYVTQSDEWKLDNGEIIGFGRKPSDHNIHAFQGTHRRYVLVVIDEACGVASSMWTAVEAITTTGDARILAIGNPDDRDTEFGRVCLLPQMEKLWNRVKISAFSTPNFTDEPVPALLRDVLLQKEWVEDRKQAWGEDDPRYQAKVLAEFPETSVNSLFGAQVLASAFDSDDVEAEGKLIVAVDPARYGDDTTAVVARRGRLAWVQDSWKGMDTTSSARRALRIVTDLRREKEEVELRVDAIGLGAGVVDAAMAMLAESGEPGIEVVEMLGSSAAQEADGTKVPGYGNARALWYDRARQYFLNGVQKVSAHEQLFEELQGARFLYSSGRLYIESKDDIRKRTGGSPDFADALVYACADRPPYDAVAGDVLAASPEQLLGALGELMAERANRIGPM